MSKQYSNLAHVPWAVGAFFVGLIYLVICFFVAHWLGYKGMIGVAMGAPWLLAFDSITPMIAREVAQREYEWIKWWGGGLRINMPDLAGLKFWNWSKHSLLETAWCFAFTLPLALACDVFLWWWLFA